MHNTGRSGTPASGAGKALKASGEDALPNALNNGAMNTAAPGAADSGGGLFRKIYNEIAKSNKIAQNNNGSKNGTGSELLKRLDISEGAQDPDIQQILDGNTAAQSAGTLSLQGASLIRDAIATITKALNLKTQGGLENFGSVTPSQGMVDQLAELLSTLKGIAGVLDESVTMNQPLEYRNLSLDVSAAANLQQLIHEQMFKIEIGLKMMGISGDVSAVMAQKDSVVQDAVAVMSGIPQATDPSKLSMPAIHARQVMGEVFESKEQKVDALLTKLAETLKESGSSDAHTAALVAKITGTTAFIQGNPENAKASDMKDLGPLDSQVMRKLLKVDNAQATASENKNAAQQNVSLGLPKEGLVLAGKTLTDALAKQKSDDLNTQAVPNSQNSTALVSDKLMSTLRADEPNAIMRQIEDSVIQQVADKLSNAVKTGVSEIRVMLRPESLGDVQMRIRVEGDVVTGKMYVENQQVKHIIEANLQTLKDSLSQQHLTMGSFSVDVNHGNGTYGQTRDMAGMNGGGGERNGNNEDGADETEKSGLSKTFVSGVDTGRKFGTNTIEYFA
jgi:flagellar hook-length control protein FliK